MFGATNIYLTVDIGYLSLLTYGKLFYNIIITIILIIIIQQIVTMPIYGKEALNICHPT